MSKRVFMEASSKNRYLYNPALKDRARSLRNNGTIGEAMMWKYVLKSRMTGYQFHRQRPILNFIADFMCKELLLIIEVDGPSHDDPFADATRQQELENVGFKVLRYRDNDVVKSIENTCRTVHDEIARRVKELECES